MAEQPTFCPPPPLGNLVETLARQIAAAPGDPSSSRYRARWAALAEVLHDIEAERAGMTRLDNRVR